MSVTDREKAAIEGAPRQLFIGGEWRDSATARSSRSTIPSTGETICEIADADARRRPSGDRRRGFGAGRMGAQRSQRAQRDPLARLRADSRAHRRSRPDHDPGDGQVGGRVEGRAHLRGRVLSLVLGRGAAHRRLLQGGGQRAPRVCSSCASRSGPATSSPPGTFPTRWARERSDPPLPRAARWSSSPPSRPRCRCWRWRSCSPTPASPTAS